MGFEIRQVLYISYLLLHSKLLANLVDVDNKNYFSFMVLWVRDSDRTEWGRLSSALQYLTSQLGDLETGG